MKKIAFGAGRRAGAPLLAAAAAVLVLLGGCGKGSTDKAAGGGPGRPVGEAAPVVFAVNTTRSVLGQITDYIEVNGDVETLSTVDLFADIAGKIVRLPISVGQRVTKGTVIAEVDPSRPGSVFVASPVRSSIDGTITDIPVNVGSTITQATPIARVTTTDRIRVSSRVAERFISKIRLGLDAVLEFEAYPGEKFPARIIEVSPVVDPQTRTLELKIGLLQPDRRIKAGMFAAIKIVTEKKDKIVKIPADCVVRRFGSSFVFVVKPVPGEGDSRVVERRQITPGILIDDKLEIAGGLEPDEEVVILGQTLLEDGSAVKVVGEVPPLPAADRLD